MYMTALKRRAHLFLQNAKLRNGVGIAASSAAWRTSSRMGFLKYPQSVVHVGQKIATNGKIRFAGKCVARSRPLVIRSASCATLFLQGKRCSYINAPAVLVVE